MTQYARNTMAILKEFLPKTNSPFPQPPTPSSSQDLMALCSPICLQRDTICRGGVGRGLTTIHLTSRQSRMRPQTRKRLIDSLFLFLMILPTYPMPLQSIFFTGQPIFLMAFKNINAIVCVNIVCDVIILRDRNKVALTGLGGNSA